MSTNCNKTKSSNPVDNNINNICRTCLLSKGATSMNEVVNQETISIRKILQLCTNLQVSEHDHLPQKMCDTCVTELVKAYKFIIKCKNSNSILHSIEKTIIENDILVEIIEEQDEYKEDETQTKLNGFDCTKTENNNVNVEKNPVIKSLDVKLKKDKGLKSNKRKYKQQKVNADKILDRTCSICSKVFSAPFLLRQHMRSHTNERPYHCNTCSASFTNSSNLRRHMRIHTGEKPHICDICNKAYSQTTTLLEHKRTHTGEKPYVCCYCGKSFCSYANHKTHLLKHSMEINSSVESTGDELTCNQCGRVLSSKGALKTHMLVHGDRSFLCSNCGKRFVNKVSFVNHYRTHTGEKPFKCDQCEKSFSLQASLKQHILIHTGEKPYRCKICSKGFIQYHQLKYHLRTHSGERPYVCLYCGKAFALNGNLTVHKRIHTGETPYHCSVCNKGFYDSSSMKKHMKGHTNHAGDIETIYTNNSSDTCVI